LAAEWTIVEYWFESQQGQKISLSSVGPIPALGPKRHTNQWAQAALPTGIERTGCAENLSTYVVPCRVSVCLHLQIYSFISPNTVAQIFLVFLYSSPHREM